MQTYSRFEYECELRKLTHCEDDFLHPVTPYGRTRLRLYEAIDSTNPAFTRAIAAKEHYAYLIEEIFYRAVERAFLLGLPDAKKALDYKGDADGTIYEMVQRVEGDVSDYWKRKEIVDEPEKGTENGKNESESRPQKRVFYEVGNVIRGKKGFIAREISKYALLLYFDMMPKCGSPNLFERMRNNDSGWLARNLKELFPEQGYRNAEFRGADHFVQAYRMLRDIYNMIGGYRRKRCMMEFSLINPDPEWIKTFNIRFDRLVHDGKRLSLVLRNALKNNSMAYISVALQQWKEEDFPSNPEPDSLKGNSFLVDSIKRLQAQVDARSKEIEKLQQDMANLKVQRDTVDSELILRLVSSYGEAGTDWEPKENGIVEISRKDWAVIRQKTDQLKAEKEHALEKAKDLKWELEVEIEKRKALQKELQELKEKWLGQSSEVSEQTAASDTEDNTEEELPDIATLTEEELLQQVYHFDERSCRIFIRAREKGLMSFGGGHYKWLKNQVLLDYFLGRALCDDLINKDGVWSYHIYGKPLPVKDMNRLFNRDNIGNNRRRYNNTRSSPPKDHELIDNIINEFPKGKAPHQEQAVLSSGEKIRPM